MIWFENYFLEIPVSHIALEETGVLLFQSFHDKISIYFINNINQSENSLSYKESVSVTKLESMIIESLGP